MRFFKSDKSAKDKEYVLFADWRVKLTDHYTHIDNGDSGQLHNDDLSRIIYGSSFVIDESQLVEDAITVEKIEVDDAGDYTLKAKVAQSHRILVMVINYEDESDKEWAISVVNSAHLGSA